MYTFSSIVQHKHLEESCNT